MSGSTDIGEEQANEIVLRIARSKGWVRPELRQRSDPETQEFLRIIKSVREELGDAVETIARDIYSRKARFILELIQNAEDNTYSRGQKSPSITFEVRPDNIVIECNEDGFTEANVLSICRTGKSSKKSKRGYIGEKGIGFKSVFQVASKVHIQSNSFSFSFQYNGGASSEEKLGIITPVPEGEPIPLSDRPLTRMTLTPLESIPYEDLLAQFQIIPDTLLLFLSTIKELKIKVYHSYERMSVMTFHKSEDLRARMIHLIKTVEDADDVEKKVQETRYYIARKQIVKLPADKARLGIDECEVVLAFPLQETSTPLISAQDVFAFLPLRTFGFSFLIQADFILQASRQDVIDLPRNKAILYGVAKVFRNAVLEFCKSDTPLRHQWMRFLPSSHALDEFWKELPSNIIKLLKREAILYSHASVELGRPGDLWTLPESHLDEGGSPLFQDLPGVDAKYLSRQYTSKDIKILAKAFNIKDIEDIDMFNRIKQDLSSPSSKMKALDTDEDWHRRAADLIVSILERSPDVEKLIRGLDLIPLVDGRWVNAFTEDIYFPVKDGPEIPRDLISTIDSKATRNSSRKELFAKLGATSCLRKCVSDKVFACYLKDGGASDLSSSMAHLSYLYWNYRKVDDPRFSRLWLYDRDNKKVTSRQKVMYLQSEDEYSAHELLKAVQHPTDPRKSTPGCPVPFVNPAYMNLHPQSTLRHEVSWLHWLEKALGVRRIPRLKFDGGSLSTEFRHIIRYRPDKVALTLKKHWAIYQSEMTSAIVDTLSQADVACSCGQLQVLKDTFLPLPSLKEKVQNLGIKQGFPFLQIPDAPDEQLLRDWRFLKEFGVGYEPGLFFYVEVLKQHEAQTHQSWGSEAQGNILKTYQLIAEHCSDKEKDWLFDYFDESYLILHPCAFLQTASAPTWIDNESCVWYGPENLLDKTPLASVPQYRDNKALKHFFRRILRIGDADWKDYLEMLLKLSKERDPVDDISNKVLRLYRLISEVVKSKEDWAIISDSFEKEELIYEPSIACWFPPSECLWASPVPIVRKIIVSDSYPEDLKNFFLERLRISPASLNTLVEELKSLAGRHLLVPNVKKIIWAINAMDPKEGDLDSLLTSDVLPVRRGRRVGFDSNVFLQSCQTDFVVIDRVKLAEIFGSNTAFLDFSLEEVQQLYPFLHALGLDKKYLSLLYEEETICDDSGLPDSNRTAEFHQRAYDLLRCAVSYRSPRARNPRSLYDLLLRTSILRTDSISTRYTLRQASGDKIVQVPSGYVHIREQENRLEIFVPRNQKYRELCYQRQFPEALSKLFCINLSAREIIGNVLNSSTFIIDDLLEAAGIGEVSEIQPPPRPSGDDFDEQETVVMEETASSFGASRAQSAPLLTSRNTTGQNISTSRANLINGDSSHNFADAETSHSPLTSSRGSRASTPSTTMSDSRDSPGLSSYTDSALRPSREPANLPHRRSSQEDINQRNHFYYNAYIELLDHVIRIANRINVPHRGFIAGPGSARLLPGFDHEAAFGIRSQGQMNHDTRIGAAGELFVFEILSNLMLPSFGRHDWKSTIRKEVTIHPKYRDMVPWNGAETADITFKDVSSAFTSLLIQTGHLEEQVWRGARPHYFIEVKTTTGDCNDRFFMSNSQYLRMQRMTLTPGQSAAEVYIIFRVFNLGKEGLNLKVYVDPEAYGQRNELVFEPQSWTVTPRA